MPRGSFVEPTLLTRSSIISFTEESGTIASTLVSHDLQMVMDGHHPKPVFNVVERLFIQKKCLVIGYILETKYVLIAS
jgi:hypothetical protein